MSESIRSSMRKTVQRPKNSSKSTATRRPSVVEGTTTSNTSSSVVEVATISTCISPMLRLAAGRHFDKIENDLRNQSTDVELFLLYGQEHHRAIKNRSKNSYGGDTSTQTMHHSMATVDTVPNSLSSTSGSSNNTNRRSRIPFPYNKPKLLLKQQQQSNREKEWQRQRQHQIMCPHYPTTPLHKILEYRPPYSTVSLLCRALTNLEDARHTTERSRHLPLLQILTPDAEATNAIASSSPVDITDDMGRKPLHIACEYGCDLTVVKRLLKGTSYARPFMTCDIHKRTPLHYACANPRGSSSNTTSKLLKTLGIGNSNNSKSCENMTQIIECLVNIYPRATILKDEWGQTPLDLAVENQASPKIIEILTRTSEKVYYTAKHRHQNNNNEEQLQAVTAPSLHLEIEQQNQQSLMYELPKALAVSDSNNASPPTTRRRSILIDDELIEDSSMLDLEASDAKATMMTPMISNQQFTQQTINGPHTYPGSRTVVSTVKHRTRTCGSVAGRTLVKLNEHPIDLDKEMDNMRKEFLASGFKSNIHPDSQFHETTNNFHHTNSLDETDVPSLVDLVIECKVGTNDNDEDIVDDTSSLGSDCISKHFRPAKFEPFVNVHELVDI
jgi:ankyrin repeat protein